MVGPLNNREVASAFWLAVLATWALTKADVRASLWGVLRAFLRCEILVTVCVVALYTEGALLLLAAVHMWDVSLLKDSIVWFCASAMAMVARSVTSKGSGSIFRRLLAENLTIMVILEFLVNTYTFSLTPNSFSCPCSP